jgi:hypothetical protein
MEVLASLRRRWILTTILFVFTLAATAAALVKLPWTYSAQSSVVFLASDLASKPYGGNPYLAFGSTLNQTADVIRYEVSDQRTALALAAGGYPDSYTVVDAVDTAGPILQVTVTGSNPATVEHTLSGVTQQIASLLGQQQSGINRFDQIREQVLTFAVEPSRLTSKKSRPLSVVFGIGIVFTIAIPLIVDAALLRRKRGRQEDDWMSDEWTEAKWHPVSQPQAVGLGSQAVSHGTDMPADDHRRDGT